MRMADRMQKMRSQGKLVEGCVKLHSFFTKMNQKAKASEKGQNLHALLCRAKILDSAGSSEEFSNSSCEDFVSYKHDKGHTEKGTPQAIADNASDNERQEIVLN